MSAILFCDSTMVQVAVTRLNGRNCGRRDWIPGNSWRPALDAPRSAHETAVKRSKAKMSGWSPAGPRFFAQLRIVVTSIMNRGRAISDE